MNIKKLTILFILFIPLVLSGCSKDKGKSEAIEENSIAVEVAKVEPKTITNNYETIGKLHAREEVNVSSKVNGKVKNVNFKVGDIVKKGDILYTVENEDLINSADLQKSKYKTSVEESDLKYEEALKNFNNMKALYESEAISKTDFESAQTSYEKAKLSYEQAQRDLSSSLKSLDSSISDTIVRSPINGIVSERNIELGELTGATDFVIVNINSVLVKTNVPEDIINTLSPGKGVKINIQSKEYIGRVSSISPIGLNNVNIYPVEIEISNKDFSLKTGMFADVYFEIEKMENQVQIPKKSVLTKGNEDYVYIVKDNSPKKVVIEKGLVDSGFVQIKKGLNLGELLVVKGQEYLQENSKITIVSDVK